MSRHGNPAFAMFKTPWAETYPGLLRAAGYWVGHVGKWHNGKFPAEHFDFARAYGDRHWQPEPGGGTIHVTKKNERDALEFLRTRPSDQPFCLTLAFFATHAQDGHPKQYLYQPESEALYQDVTIPIPKTASEDHFKKLPPFVANEKNEGRNRWRWRFDTPEKYQEYMKAYYRLATEVDTVCGRLLEELKRTGLLDKTLVIFTTDNGYFHGERGMADKWYPYEESIRVPLIVRGPGFARNAHRPEMVANVDLAPTILNKTGAVAGAAHPLDGRPLLSSPARQELLLEERAWEAIRTPTSLYARYRDLNGNLTGEEELYDLTTDPYEVNSLHADPGSLPVKEQLRARLDQIQHCIGAECP
jgi:arylsulfatase A-like enzyme